MTATDNVSGGRGQIVYASRHLVCLVLLCRRVAVSYFQIGLPDSLLIASEDSRDWQRARVHGGRRDRETHKALGAWAPGGRAHMTWYDKTGLNWP